MAKRITYFVVGCLIWAGLSLAVNAVFSLGLSPLVTAAIGIAGGIASAAVWTLWERSNPNREPFDD